MDEFLQNRKAGSGLLAKWLNVLFWIIIVTTALRIFSDNSLTDTMPRLAFGTVTDIVMSILYGVVLRKISSESSRYKKAAVCRFVSVAAMLLFAPFADESNLMITLPASAVLIVVDLIGTYFEFAGHADVLAGVDDGFSAKWRRLWKYYIGPLAALLAGLLIAVAVPAAGLVIMAAALVVWLVVIILKIIYVRRMVKTFRFLTRRGTEKD